MKSEVKPTVQFHVNIQLTEGEARAWDAIVGYGWEAFIKVFEEKLGSHYINPHKKDAEQLFKDTRSIIGMQLHGIDKARKAISEIGLKGANEVVDN